MDNGAAVGGPHHSRHGLYPAPQLHGSSAAAAAGTKSSSGDYHTHRALIRLKRDLAEMRQGGELFTCGCVNKPHPHAMVCRGLLVTRFPQSKPPIHQARAHGGVAARPAARGPAARGI